MFHLKSCKPKFKECVAEKFIIEDLNGFIFYFYVGILHIPLVLLNAESSILQISQATMYMAQLPHHTNLEAIKRLTLMKLYIACGGVWTMKWKWNLREWLMENGLYGKNGGVTSHRITNLGRWTCQPLLWFLYPIGSFFRFPTSIPTLLSMTPF